MNKIYVCTLSSTIIWNHFYCHRNYCRPRSKWYFFIECREAAGTDTWPSNCKWARPFNQYFYTVSHKNMLKDGNCHGQLLCFLVDFYTSSNCKQRWIFYNILTEQFYDIHVTVSNEDDRSLNVGQMTSENKSSYIEDSFMRACIAWKDHVSDFDDLPIRSHSALLL